MRDAPADTGDGLPDELRQRLEPYARRRDWQAVVSLLIDAAERRAAPGERIACYLRAAEIYETRFANNAEATRVLEFALRSAPDHPFVQQRLHELYTRARRRHRLRQLANDRGRLAADAPAPKPPRPITPSGDVADAAPEPAGVLARIGAGLFAIALPAAVTATNMHLMALVERHDNSGGFGGWVSFALMDVLLCAIFVALVWLPARWAVRRVGDNALLIMLTLLSATCLIAMVPTLGWNAIDAANVLWDRSEARTVVVEVVEHTRRGKSGPFPVIREPASARAATTRLMWTLGLEPVGSVHELRRGDGRFGRAYYMRPVPPLTAAPSTS